MFKTSQFKNNSLALLMLAIVAIQYLLVLFFDRFTMDMLTTSQHVANVLVATGSLLFIYKHNKTTNNGQAV